MQTYLHNQIITGFNWLKIKLKISKNLQLRIPINIFGSKNNSKLSFPQFKYYLLGSNQIEDKKIKKKFTAPNLRPFNCVQLKTNFAFLKIFSRKCIFWLKF